MDPSGPAEVDVGFLAAQKDIGFLVAQGDVGLIVAQGDVGLIVEQYQEAALEAATFVSVLALIYVVGRVLVVPSVVRAVRARNPRNATLVYATEQYLKVGFFLLALPIATSAAGYGDVFSGSALVIAAATVAVGVAGQQVIGNLASGVFLVADPDFNVGDYIEWDGQAGTVERITLRVTRVRTLADETLTVPNTALATTAVRNPYARQRYRVSETVTVAYREDLDRVRSALVDVARELDGVAAEPEPFVAVGDLAESGVQLEAMFWVVDPRPEQVGALSTEFNARAKARLGELGVDLSPPDEHELSGSVDVDGDAP